MSTMLTFSVFSVIFLLIGIVLQVMSDRIMELEKRYDLECLPLLQKDNVCVMDFQTIDSPIEGPVYVYYQLDNFY